MSDLCPGHPGRPHVEVPTTECADCILSNAIPPPVEQVGEINDLDVMQLAGFLTAYLLRSNLAVRVPPGWGIYDPPDQRIEVQLLPARLSAVMDRIGWG